MAATARHQEELRRKALKAEQTSQDPIEILRAKCLSRGASGINGKLIFKLLNQAGLVF